MTLPPDDSQAPPTAPVDPLSDDASGTTDAAVDDAQPSDAVVDGAASHETPDAASPDDAASDATLVDAASDAVGFDAVGFDATTDDDAAEPADGDQPSDTSANDAETDDAAPATGSDPVPATADDEPATGDVESDDVPVDAPDDVPVAAPDDAPAAAPVDGMSSPRPTERALAWVSAASVTPVAVSTLSDATAPFVPAAEAELLPHPKRRSALPVVVPIVVTVGLVGSYAATTLLWPLDEVSPTVTQSRLATVASPPADVVWPAEGSAAVGVIGVSTRASTAEMTQMASITKVITASMVLAERPIALGEQGEAFTFTWQDSSNYWQYLQRNESALDVPVDGTLTEYQLLQGVMLGSAGNYTDYLADWVWEDRQAFRTAAEEWLTANGLAGIEVVEPTGIDYGNMATPAALVALGDVALRNPVFAEIVAQSTAELPGAGLVTNSNKLIDDPGVIGIKTGTLDGWNLLVAKEVEVDGVTVRIVASILDQPDDDTRTAVSRDILDQVTTQLTPTPAFPAGTVIGNVETVWGASAQMVTTDDATVVGWNGSLAKPTIALDLGDRRADGDQVGSLTVAGPLNTVEIPVALNAEIPAPDAWWRLTHPFELFGWDD